jgi:hypothetical protein
MNDLYETWLAGLAAEDQMERLAGYGIAWKHLAEGDETTAEEYFLAADEYCAAKGWRLPVQIKWQAEIKRTEMIRRLRTTPRATTQG